jgi:hypothetical protein
MRPSVRCRHGFLTTTALFLASAGMASTLAGCEGEDIQEVSGTVEEMVGAPPAGATAVPFEEFQDDVGSAASREVRVLIRTASGYRAYFGHPAPATVDFRREWVIFYAAGTKPTGGYQASVLSLTLNDRDLLAVTRLVSPGQGCAVTQALTAPHVLVKFAAQPGSAVRFRRSDQVRDCGPADPCAAVRCAAGTHCVATDIVCITTPCDPVAECVPDGPARCGGIAGIPCPDGQTCVDDPGDSCDPKRGGADCGGICQAKGGGEPCGATTCAEGMFCCNASCGICAPPGGACIQIACL